jgi:hypothetical protein
MTQMQLAHRMPFRWEAKSRKRPAPSPAAISATQAARRGTASMDRALYSCACGFAFKAEVTTSVGCPHCGTSQAW